MSWNNDVVLEFVELYRRQQLLWDPKHPSYRNRSEIAAAWCSIQRSLSIQCSISELKRKKESLMTSFRMHFSKKKRQDSYRTTWFAYNLMESFLGGKYECDSTVTQIESELFTATPTNTERSRKRNTIDRNNSSANRQQQEDGIGGVKHEPDISYINKHRAEITYCKVNDTKADTDECDLYAQLLAKKLRKLDEHQRDVAMHEIDNIMFRAKMQNGGPSQRKSFSSSPSSVTRKVQSPIFIVTPQSHQQYEDENISYQEEVSQLQNPP